jgi:hypothetical protein
MTTHRSRGYVRGLAALALFAGLAAAPLAHAQRNPSGMPSPRLYQVSPAGGKAGATVEVIVAGRHLEEPQKLVFSNPNVKAELVPAPQPEIDPKTKKPKPITGALPADHYKFKVTIPSDAPVGNLDVRVVNAWGVSNPRTFVVGDLNEVAEKEPNNDVDQAQKVELNTTINGTIGSATDVDYYSFTAKKGQRIVLIARSSSIDSRCIPAIEVYDSKDRQQAANRNYQGDDAVTDFTAPDDGDYSVRVFQFTHTLRTQIVGGIPAGSSDHFYRLTITTAPWIDSVVPSVIEPGKTATVTVYGRNLPNGKLDDSAKIDDVALEKITMNVTAPEAGKGKLTLSDNVMPGSGWQDGFELRLKNASGSSNAFLIGLAAAPVVVDKGDNDAPETAQAITLPCEIAGAIEKRRDRDWYEFEAKKGERLHIDVISSRLGAPTFIGIAIRNPATKADLYESPRTENTNMLCRKFFARSEDPTIAPFVVPADGKYQILVANLGDNLYGPRHTYAVRITKESADFRLVALSMPNTTPDVPTVAPGGNTAFTVLVHRDASFAGEVELSVEGLPAGVTCAPQVIGPGSRETTLAISAAGNAAEWAGEIKIKGTATIKGQKVVREARPAGIIWPVQPQQNQATFSRLERGTYLAVRGKPTFTLTPTIDKATVAQGDKATIKLKVARTWTDLKGPIQIGILQAQGLQGHEYPLNLRINNNQPLNVAANQAEATLAVTVGNDVPPGTYNVVLRGQTQVQFNKDVKSKQKQNTFVVATSSPVSITVLPKALATLSVTNQNPSVKIGGETKVVVRVKRQFEYDGAFEVQLELPKGQQGVTADKVTIPAGKDEVELVLKAPTAATAGNRGGVVVRATALFNKTPIVHETKINVNVVK